VRFQSVGDTELERELEVARLVLAAGADVNARLPYSQDTPLHFAIYQQKTELISLLLDRGADVNARDGQGRTPLDWAIWFRQREMAEMLRVAGRTPLHAAAAAGDRNMILLLLRHGADLRGGPGGVPPYREAVVRGHKALADELLLPR
jgi:ankyrin repeat protein